jgi:hypothetical protein
MNRDKRRNHYVVNWKESIRAYLERVGRGRRLPERSALSASFPKGIVVVPPKKKT